MKRQDTMKRRNLTFLPLIRKDSQVPRWLQLELGHSDFNHKYVKYYFGAEPVCCICLYCAPLVYGLSIMVTLSLANRPTRLYTQNTKAKTFILCVCFEPKDRYVNAEKRNCMKLGSIKAIYCTMPETNRFDFKIIFEIRIRNWIRWGHYLILEFTFQPTSANSFERTE